MSLFLIETKEFINNKEGWRKIGETPVVAEHVSEALNTIDQQYKGKQYSHEAIIERINTTESKFDRRR